MIEQKGMHQNQVIVYSASSAYCLQHLSHHFKDDALTCTCISDDQAQVETQTDQQQVNMQTEST